MSITFITNLWKAGSSHTFMWPWLMRTLYISTYLPESPQAAQTLRSERMGEFLEAVSQWGKVARGCNKQQLKAFFSLYKLGQNLSRGDLTGGVTSENACIVGFFRIDRNTLGTHGCPPRYDPRSNNQTSAYAWRQRKNRPLSRALP